MIPTTLTISPEKFDAVLFDLDGVITATARLHAAAWKKMFDEFLEAYAKEKNQPFTPFDLVEDYKHYVDGKPRYDGVRDFLEARHIKLPEGSPPSPSKEKSVHGLGNRKNDFINQVLEKEGVDVFEDTLQLIKQLRTQGIKIAVVSSSKNCEAVLKKAGIEGLFDARVDGTVAEKRNLRGKPAPDTYLEAAKELGVQPGRAVVVEDAISGVQSGKAGKFGLVIGVDRKNDSTSLLKNGAHVAVKGMKEFLA